MTATDVPGSATMRKQLTHILFVQVLRTLLAPRGIAPGWLGALSDRQVGAALTLLHEQPWRIQTAARALRLTDRTVAAIGADLGYTSESAFSNAFKRVLGQSPSRYRSAHASAGTR